MSSPKFFTQKKKVTYQLNLMLYRCLTVFLRCPPLRKAFPIFLIIFPLHVSNRILNPLSSPISTIVVYFAFTVIPAGAKTTMIPFIIGWRVVVYLVYIFTVAFRTIAEVNGTFNWTEHQLHGLFVWLWITASTRNPCLLKIAFISSIASLASLIFSGVT